MWRKAAVAGALVGLAALCGPAWAHGPFGVLGSGPSVWDGTLHLVTSPLSLASMFGLVLAVLGLKEPWTVVVALLAGAAAAGAAAMPAQLPASVAPAAIVVLGLCAVAGWKPSVQVSGLLAVVAGLAAGAAADFEGPRIQDLIGIGLTVMIVVVALLSALDDMGRARLSGPIMPMARRVVGSWIAAMGLLLGALAVLGLKT